MAKLARDDGVELHWESRGDGPTVILAPYWQGHPSVFENLISELESDHRLVTYDARGTGQSTRQGPHDMDTGAEDLAAIAEAAGGNATAVGLSDGVNRTVRAADAHPDLIPKAVGLGLAPLSREMLPKLDAPIGSEGVIEAFIEMLSGSYRGALRTFVPATNKQMSEEEVDRRIDEQVAYVPQDVAVERVKAWAYDDALEPARRLGERLWFVYSQDMAGMWAPSGGELVRIYRDFLPDAHYVEVEDGMISRPDLSAAVVRKAASGIKSSV